MKQDNRPPRNSPESQLDALTQMLREEPVRGPDTETETQQKQEKIVIISVTGNNNIITAEKAKHVIGHNDRKTFFVAGAMLCMLFF